MSLKSFFDYLEIEKKYSSNTIEAYRNDLNVFAGFLIDEFDVNNINNTSYSYIRSWIVDLVNKGISNRSINRKITSLNSYFKFLLKIDLINENPLTNHKALKTQKKIQLPFSENEMLNVLDLNNYEIAEVVGIDRRNVSKVLLGRTKSKTTGIKRGENNASI